MLANYHTHTVFCDGKDTAEEFVAAAINKGFSALGFSGHAPVSFDDSYCMKDVSGYIAEINRLKEKYKKDIEIYLGIEEDCSQLCDRSLFEYVIGSCHYIKIGGRYYSIDGSCEEYDSILQMFQNDPVKLAEEYYKGFCDYITARKPDIVGHFDLLTKFEEKGKSVLFSSKEYNRVAEKYLEYAAKSDCVFEVNTGAIARGYRTSPYPAENLLYVLKKNNSRVIISSDCHSKDFLDCNFKETELLLKDIGFEYIYSFLNNEFVKEKL